MLIKRAADIINEVLGLGSAAAGISGGADSMCLLYLIAKSGFADRVTVLHIDHGLRATSKRDRQIVEEFCNFYGIKIRVFTPDILEGARLSKRSIETEARAVRHKIFSDFASENSCSVLLAHNQDDNVESILMHVFRGCGIGGLVGMSEFDGHLVRPLLGVKKSEIYAFAAQNGIIFGEDETNQDIGYRRNFLRHWLTGLEDGFPSAKSSVIQLSKIAAQTQEILLDILDKTLIKKEENAVLLTKTALNTSLAAQYVICAIQTLGIKTDIEQKHVMAVIALADSQVGKSIDLPHGLRVFSEENHLAFCICTPTDPTENTPEKDFSEGINEFCGQTFLITPVPILPQKGEIIVDADLLTGAKIRFRESGDVFKPCNGKTKNLSDFLLDKKIPLRIRDSLPLLVKGNQVLVVVGIELSDSIKITGETKKAYKISCKTT